MIAKPKISIILFCKNAEKFIETAIKSVIDQNYKNYELIVLDGNSSDNTVGIIRKYHENIAYFHSKPDRGAADAQNQGLDIFTGDLVSFLCADDWFEPEYFSAIAQSFMQNPLIEIISCGTSHVVKSSDKKIQTIRSYNTLNKIEISLNDNLFRAPNFSAKFFSHKFIKTVGKFILYRPNKQYFYANDLEFLIRAVLLKPKTILIPKIYHCCLSHQDSINFGASNKFILELLNERIEMLYNFIRNQALNNRDKKIFIRWLVDTQLRYLLRSCASLNFSRRFIGKYLLNILLHPILSMFIMFKNASRLILRFSVRIYG